MGSIDRQPAVHEETRSRLSHGEQGLAQILARALVRHTGPQQGRENVTRAGLTRNPPLQRADSLLTLVLTLS